MKHTISFQPDDITVRVADKPQQLPMFELLKAT